ncbi:unnamed protein product [Durusdinium trenchii]|uniref:RING-type domain-containing protein n=1 Tax=Durusdinium trenchii TaxID=1381693 RepID=A0ABP0M8H7_9DINO
MDTAALVVMMLFLLTPPTFFLILCWGYQYRGWRLDDASDTESGGANGASESTGNAAANGAGNAAGGASERPRHKKSIDKMTKAFQLLPEEITRNPSTCTICLDVIELGEKVKVLPCDHRYHNDCFLSWSTHKASKTKMWGIVQCPVCRNTSSLTRTVHPGTRLQGDAEHVRSC